MQLLKFSRINQKLDKLALEVYKHKDIYPNVFSMSIPSGRVETCPYADKCKAYVDKGKLVARDDYIDYRCYSASSEARLPSQLKQRDYNFDLLKACNNDVQELTNLINASIPIEAHIIRIHVGGDFYSQSYFDAWLNVAMLNPQKRFYSYTKSLPFWVNRLDSINVGNFPNMELIASRGGKKDKLIDEYKLREAVVVYKEEEAMDKGLEIDYTDYIACYGKESFALLIHGNQPKRINQLLK
tara:strand:- start:336 stop:1058 length:723 start_codon:yes stop_codon:yes gene_type:complete